MSVTFTASGNATPASGTVVATCVIGGENYQLAILTGVDGQPLGGSTSPFHVAVTNSPSVIVGSGSLIVTNQISASISNTIPVSQSGAWTVTAGNAAGSAAGSPLFVAEVRSAGSAAGSPLFARVSDGTDTAAITAASELLVSVNNTVTVAQGASGAHVWSTALRDSAGNAYGVGAGSPLFITGGAAGGTSAGDTDTYAEGTTNYTPVGGVFLESMVALTASQAGAARMTAQRALHTSLRDAAGNAQGAGPASPLYVSACVTTLGGSAIGTPLFVAEVRAAGSAAGSPLFASITNQAGSAAGSPLFVLQTNMGGSAAGSPLFSSITNLAGSATGSPLFVRVGDGTDTAFVDVASRLAVALTDGANAYGLAGSPLPVVEVINQMYYAGSLLALSLVDLSASISGCTAIVASLAGFATVVVGATFTTSNCQLIGWTACGNNGGASALVQSPMAFGTNGGMSEADLLWQFPSGSIAVLTTTSACYVRGRLKYLRVAS